MTNIGILGTGGFAVAMGRAWAAVGHAIVVTGRDPGRAGDAAQKIGPAARAVDVGDFARSVDVVVIAVAWEGLETAIGLVGGPRGALAGRTVLDCTVPVLRTGPHKMESGSAAEMVARLAAGAHVVKALHLFAGASWPYTGAPQAAPVVAVCGDEPSALETAAQLVADLGAHTAVVGGLDSARQAEETAGFVLRVVGAGRNPRFAVPDVDPARRATA
ncbi:NADPH-dependent F420 reductase [Catenulispora yoronensis]|uniref:NADPH-dependent F420 reductase n=1 Tax=Catenulispora yoronensis TaxID=450799 RepID=A0ABP5FK44_9ACTN